VKEQVQGRAQAMVSGPLPRLLSIVVLPFGKSKRRPRGRNYLRRTASPKDLTGNDRCGIVDSFVISRNTPSHIRQAGSTRSKIAASWACACDSKDSIPAGWGTHVRVNVQLITPRRAETKHICGQSGSIATIGDWSPCKQRRLPSHNRYRDQIPR